MATTSTDQNSTTLSSLSFHFSCADIFRNQLDRLVSAVHLNLPPGHLVSCLSRGAQALFSFELRPHGSVVAGVGLAPHPSVHASGSQPWSAVLAQQKNV